MEKSISIRLLFLLTKIAYWGLIIVMVIVVIAGIVMLTLDPELMKLSFPASMSHFKDVIYLNDGALVPVEIEFYADQIEVPVKHLDRIIMSSTLLYSLSWLFILTMIFKYFKLFIRRVLDGKIFQSKSILLLKKAALGLVILYVIDLIYGLIGHYFVQRNFEFNGLENHLTFSFPSTLLIMSLTLWSLAHIFEKGKELEDEQKLTV